MESRLRVLVCTAALAGAAAGQGTAEASYIPEKYRARAGGHAALHDKKVADAIRKGIEWLSPIPNPERPY